MSFSDENMTRLEKLIKLAKNTANSPNTSDPFLDPTAILVWESLADELTNFAIEFRVAAEAKRKEVIDRMRTNLATFLNSADDSGN